MNRRSRGHETHFISAEASIISSKRPEGRARAGEVHGLNLHLQQFGDSPRTLVWKTLLAAGWRHPAYRFATAASPCRPAALSRRLQDSGVQSANIFGGFFP